MQEAMTQLHDARSTAENALALLTPEPPMIALSWRGLDRALSDPAQPPIITMTGFGRGAEVRLLSIPVCLVLAKLGHNGSRYLLHGNSVKCSHACISPR
jgi:hypothetical protein